MRRASDHFSFFTRESESYGHFCLRRWTKLTGECTAGARGVSATSAGLQTVHIQLNSKEVVRQCSTKHLCRRQSPTLGPTGQGLALSGWLTCLASHSTYLCGQPGLALRASGAATCVVWLAHSVQGTNSEPTCIVGLSDSEHCCSTQIRRVAFACGTPGSNALPRKDPNTQVSFQAYHYVAAAATTRKLAICPHTTQKAASGNTLYSHLPYHLVIQLVNVRLLCENVPAVAVEIARLLWQVAEVTFVSKACCSPPRLWNRAGWLSVWAPFAAWTRSLGQSSSGECSRNQGVSASR